MYFADYFNSYYIYIDFYNIKTIPFVACAIFTVNSSLKNNNPNLLTLKEQSKLCF